MCQKISENAIDMIVVKESLRNHKVFINKLPNRKIYIQASFHDAHCVTMLEKLPKKECIARWYDRIFLERDKEQIFIFY